MRVCNVTNLFLSALSAGALLLAPVSNAQADLITNGRIRHTRAGER